MNSDLERRIKRLKKEAVKKNLFEKARVIAESLGQGIGGGYYNDRSAFNRSPFYIESARILVDDDLLNLFTTVKYSEKLVFEGGVRFDETKDQVHVGAYIPGKWEEEFEDKYIQALSIKNSKNVERKKGKRREELEREMDQLERFGLLQ